MPPLVVAGTPAVLAVEVEPEQPVDPEWVLGRFCLWVSGARIGDQEDVVTLKAVIAWWRSFVGDGESRWDEQLAGLEADAAFQLLYGSRFGDFPPSPVPDADRFFVEQLGMSAFDAYDVLLVDDPQGQQRLTWRHRDGPVQTAVLEPLSMQRVGREFVAAWTEAGLPL